MIIMLPSTLEKGISTNSQHPIVAANIEDSCVTHMVQITKSEVLSGTSHHFFRPGALSQAGVPTNLHEKSKLARLGSREHLYMATIDELSVKNVSFRKEKRKILNSNTHIDPIPRAMLRATFFLTLICSFARTTAG